MSVVHMEIGPTCRPLNARNPSGAQCISLLAKRTYVMESTGDDVHRTIAEPADEQLPLRPEAVHDGDPNGLLLADTEAWPYKLCTDVIVHGHVYSYDGHRQTTASVTVDAARQDLLVSGDRRCARSADGRVVFSDPEPFERMPLGYDRAYGGYDQGAEKAFPNLFEMIGKSLPTGIDPKIYSHCCYPRNRHGRGYYLAQSATPIEDVLLPNIEDPSDVLLPDRLIVHDPLTWWRQPLPAGTTWLHHGYFARCVYMGVQPFWKPLPDELPEFTRGYLSEDVRRINVMEGDAQVFGVQNGASLGLQLSEVNSGSLIRLFGLHPDKREVKIVIPDPPTITIRTRWRSTETASVMLHHAELYPDEGIFTVVWRGAVPADRVLLPEELDALTFSVEWRL